MLKAVLDYPASTGVLAARSRSHAASALAESQGYKPANFDRLIEIAGDDSEFETIDERLLLEAQPDFMPWLPRE